MHFFYKISASGGLLSPRSVVDPKIFKRAEDNLSAPSSFIANAHNEIYAVCMEKKWLCEKI